MIIIFSSVITCILIIMGIINYRECKKYSKEIFSLMKNKKTNMKGGKRMVQNLSTVQKDYFISDLSSQSSTLKVLLNEIENDSRVDDEFIKESLQRVEKGMRKLRKFYRAY